jgi:hypothetical protein
MDRKRLAMKPQAVDSVNPDVVAKVLPRLSLKDGQFKTTTIN